MNWSNLLKKIIPQNNEIAYTADYREYEEVKIKKSLKENGDYLKDVLSTSQDIIYREYTIGLMEVEMIMVYIDGLAEKSLINSEILENLMQEEIIKTPKKKITIDEIRKGILTSSNIMATTTFGEAIHALLRGEILIFLEGYTEVLMVDSRGGEKRGVEEPSIDQAVRGPKEGFVENLGDNIALIRRRICDPSLSVEFLVKGERTKTRIALVYLKGVIEKNSIDEIRSCLRKISCNALVSSSQVENILEGHKWSVFPQILSTERPDKVAGSILEGRAAIIIDGTPFTLITPVTLTSFMNTSDDYYQRSNITSFIRLMRYIGYFLAITMPALYIAITAYHPGMLPTALVLYITGTRVGLPLPSLVEVLLLEFALMVLVEASIRLPKPIGPTIGIVGGLVIGQAIVQAGLVSPMVIIIVAFTAISTFALPNYTFASSSRVLRFILIFAGSVLGLYGIVSAWIIITIHMASIENFGVRYLADFSPFSLKKLKDTIIKVPSVFIDTSNESLKTNKNDEI